MIVVGLYDEYDDGSKILCFLKDRSQKHIKHFYTQSEARATLLATGITEQELDMALEAKTIQFICKHDKRYPL